METVSHARLAAAPHVRQPHRIWRSARQFALGASVVAAVTLVCFRLGADAPTAAVLYLFLVVLTSLWADRVASLFIAIICILSLDAFFTPPLFHIGVTQTVDDAVALVVFATTALVVTHLMSRVRNSIETLREQASLLDLTHDSVFARDMNNVITSWNRGAEELYGWTRYEAIGKVTHELLRTKFPVPFETIMAEMLRTGRWEGELVHITRTGAPVTVASRWSLQRDVKGLPVGMLETNNDITERKRADEAVRQAEDAVRKTQDQLTHVARVTTLGEMAASIAHEVDQPLSGVVINANASLRFLNSSEPNLDEVRDGLQAIARDGRRASDVIARIRALARRTTAEKEPLDLDDVVREVVALTGAEARRARASVRAELAGNLPRVEGDRVQLQQVMLNLLLNGLDAMSAIADRPRELVISTHLEPQDRVRVAVSDSGCGMDPEAAKHVFDPFFSTKRDGMGMGLSISRSIIEQHGGRLWAVPNDGGPGTTFQFTV